MTATDHSRLAADSPQLATSIVHLYRGEMHRLTVWRQRLDVTSNWAVVLATGLATFTLGHRDVPHYTLLLGLALFSISLFMEGRRYRHMHHCKWRIYMLQLGFFAEVLDPSNGRLELPDWRGLLAADLRNTRYPISLFTAIRVRLRRNYLSLLLFLTGAWIVKLFLHPSRPVSFSALYSRLAVGDMIPPWFVGVTAVTFVLTAIALAITCPTAERIENWSALYCDLSESGETPRDAD